MSVEHSISAVALSKRYSIGARTASYRTLREAISDGAKAPFRRLRTRGSSAGGRVVDHWALRDVSFEVTPGEVVGIIGRNGAGKSTLLKVLSQITEPTSGTALIRGRIGTLLEVGTGFHPELTGRENVYLSGAILGMSRQETRRAFDDIVEFADVRAFLDTPLKRYSSGMYVRLAFAVAAFLSTEVLLVDEVLAVGDLEFQRRCLGQIGEIASGGRTVLFVSHSMASITALCSRCLLLQDGRLVADDVTSEVIERYVQDTASEGGEVTWPDSDSAPGSQLLKLHAVRVKMGPVTCRDFGMEDDITIEVDFWCLKDDLDCSVSFHLHDYLRYAVFQSRSGESTRNIGLYRATATIPGHYLNNGLFRVKAILLRDTNCVEAKVEDAVTFYVHDTAERQDGYLGELIGVVRPTLEWQFDELPDLS